MRRPDDEMKIDISELFGGDMDANPETEGARVSSQAQSAASAESHAERESKFKEWMGTREKELELKAQELERRLQEIHAQQNLENSSPSLDLSLETAAESETPTPPAAPTAVPMEINLEPVPEPEIAAAPKIETPPEPVKEEPLIDFNAPIAAPFKNPAVIPADPSAPPGQAAAPAGSGDLPGDPQKAAELKKLQADHEFLMLYDEFRNIIAHELKDLVGDKKTYTMLGRTVELARGKYPEIFRNANWDAAGNLLEDGSLESQRIIENKNALDSQKADLVLDSALSALLNLRLQAVEKGLGAGLKNKVRAHLSQWISEKVQKADREGKDPTILRRLSAFVSLA